MNKSCIIEMCGGEANALTTMGGVVSPSSRKEKLSCKLTVLTNPPCCL